MKHIVLLFGEDSFRAHEKLTHWKVAFIEKYGGDINIDELEGSTPVHQILEAAQTLPFLGEKRLVIVKNFFKDQNRDSLKEMAGLLETVPDTCTLIFFEQTPPDQRTALFKKLAGEARLEECKPLMGNQLTEWIREKMRTYGNEIDAESAAHLGTLVGSDTWQLQNEIQKLALYALPDPVTRKHIDTIVNGQLGTSIFKLTDALGQCRSDEAIRLLHELVNRGEEIPMIFAMLARQVRLLIQVLDTRQTLPSASQIAAKIKQHPYAVSSVLPQTKNFTLPQLKMLHNRLIRIDRGLKTGEFQYTANEPRDYLLHLETFILEACAAT